MIYEMRVYRCVSGRLPALLARFENHTLRIWARHGIRQAGFWTTLVGESNQDLTYLLAWESMAERETKWAAFMADKEWQSVRAETERDGAIVPPHHQPVFGPDGVLVGEVRRFASPSRKGGVPARYGHFTSGGRLIRIASTLPPVFRPNSVPRSWIRLNST